VKVIPATSNRPLRLPERASLSGPVHAKEHTVQLAFGPNRTRGAHTPLFFNDLFASTSRAEQSARKTASIVRRTALCVAQAIRIVLIRVFYPRTVPFQHGPLSVLVLSTDLTISQ
jgi:hypothetical protein